MVVDQHQRAGSDLGAQRARRHWSASAPQAAQWRSVRIGKATSAGRAALVEMHPALKAGDRHAGKMPRAPAWPAWPSTRGTREARQIGIGECWRSARSHRPVAPRPEPRTRPTPAAEARCALADDTGGDRLAAALAARSPGPKALRQQLGQRLVVKAQAFGAVDLRPARRRAANSAQPLPAAAAGRAGLDRRRPAPATSDPAVSPAATMAPIAVASAHWPCG